MNDDKTAAGIHALASAVDEMQDRDLSFAQLRIQNVKRSEQVFHKLDDWSPTDWACALAGEAGEACNLVKKLRRLDGADSAIDTPDQRAKLRLEIAVEIADVVIYADLLCARLGYNLGDMVRTKFNVVSHKRGSDILL